MRKRLLVLGVSTLVLGLGAGPAVADDSVSTQLAEQVAGSQQSANSSATSTQYKPSNQNIDVRVLSPGDNGDVTQTNSSAAQSFAGNQNSTTQTVGQTQSGGAGTALQEAGQKAGNLQHANSTAESTQVKPSNKNISVRVLSPGDNGKVKQSNESSAKSFAKNSNELDQTINQSQDSSCGCDRKKGDRGGTAIQAGGQEAWSKQEADSSAKSVQVKPSNENISVRVLSPGKNGDVKQTNESSAFSGAFNHNSTDQTLTQDQAGSRCGCKGDGGTAIQAAGQLALNYQSADSSAESKQYHPTNGNLSLRFKKSYGGGGRVDQANESMAGSFAANKNMLDQYVEQD
jgi:hypothetical protein